ncbi:hypothetical protein D3C71_1736670 [compost metagenome]
MHLSPGHCRRRIVWRVRRIGCQQNIALTQESVRNPHNSGAGPVKDRDLLVRVQLHTVFPVIELGDSAKRIRLTVKRGIAVILRLVGRILQAADDRFRGRAVGIAG